MASLLQWENDITLSKPVAAIACFAMAVFYVAVLYVPTIILRLPTPADYKQFLIRRFVCSAVSSIVSIIICASLLQAKRFGVVDILTIFGIRRHYFWKAVLIPLLLTSFLYTGSLGLKLLQLFETNGSNDWASLSSIKALIVENFENIFSSASNVLAWRNYVIAPLTEEIVFRACMIPLLLCGGFGVQPAIIFCPVLFSLAHLNHWMETYVRHNYNIVKACLSIGLQLGYTVIFGSYASFLFIRTGSFFSPLVAHIFCNYMGLPVFLSRRKGVLVLSLFGCVAFLYLIIPMTEPELYNEMTSNCTCWQGYCSWA